VRYLWLTLGVICVGLGFVGVVVPGMPATGFFVAAAWCFSKSSEKFLRWLLALPVVGPLIDDYREGRGMTLGIKISASVSLSVAVGFASLYAIPQLWARVACFVLGLIGLGYIWLRVPLRAKTKEERIS
jgi:uncharacterized protein